MSIGLTHEPDFVPSFDLTLIAGRRMGETDGTPLVVASAVGADLSVWRRTLARLVQDRPVVTWDLRGLHSSGMARSNRLDAGAHAEDGIAVTDSYEIKRFHLAGWSTGARIALEIAHRYPERVASLTLVCGTDGYSLSGGLRHLEITSVLPMVTGVGKHFASYLGAALRTLTSRPELVGLVRQSGLVGPTADTTALVDMLRSMAECDPKVLLATYEAVAGDSAPELLREIEPGTLLIAGERDPFTPLRRMEQTAESVPTATLTVYERATHYLPIEFPELLAKDLNDFMTTAGKPDLA